MLPVVRRTLASLTVNQDEDDRSVVTIYLSLFLSLFLLVYCLMQNSVELNFPEIYFYLLQIVSLFNYRGIKTIRYSMNVWESVLEAKLRQDQ